MMALWRVKSTKRATGNILKIKNANAKRVRSRINCYLYSFLYSLLSKAINFYVQKLKYLRSFHDKSNKKKHIVKHVMLLYLSKILLYLKSIHATVCKCDECIQMNKSSICKWSHMHIDGEREYVEGDKS